MPETKEQHPNADKTEKQIDKEVEDTFPASDPPSTGGTTKIVTDDEDTSSEDEDTSSEDEATGK
ncbi:hypothetical protein EN871_07385 [bacterium M00.F.Ca.ET.228.01.1.1]|uniref:hypothetical protein n=1 Tax=Paraburkholderia phenoliruptrix TaxID=252970 RepID=UPI001093221A|nr:hypothetical protein [Paraburkholderia phenoliruptrix]TGP46259.1 hypothetical protein EN871_07385 [bacterium M00.F.Ca.ET.228.01.1.1]TGS03827.1 hypothetical protein EN834_05600 [bacterium M00.F.Ca.ET.191.01.1.1]TGU07553.1 hypothetical protein EN798_11460 [bacterium M00.F.Ca.ET.155.01.1.1]MBW0446331.1 hypothetical protein [Paraburkholderia phenoliruptrix]MBW9096754.1 hypothetical protein [Paraburkholderia phenoliruptrix]